MIYPLLKTAEKLLAKVQLWARTHRTRLGILAEYRPNGEVRLIPAANIPLLPADNLAGCTLSVRNNRLIIACAETCSQIEKAVSVFLQRAKVIGQGRPAAEPEVFKRRNLRHAHEMGRQVSDEARAKRRERREEALSGSPPARFRTVLEATLAAAEAAGPWLELTERAIRTAEESHYVDPDYVYEVLMDLAHAARYSSDHRGLGMSWADFLGQRGSHDFVPNTSPYTVERYYADYHICHQGEMRCIQAHIRQGNGSANECLRIYIAQPRRYGEPVIVGHVGSHLPTSDRSH